MAVQALPGTVCGSTGSTSMHMSNVKYYLLGTGHVCTTARQSWTNRTHASYHGKTVQTMVRQWVVMITELAYHGSIYRGKAHQAW